MTSITLTMTDQDIQKMQAFYQDYLLNTVPYSVFRAKKNNTTITAYTSGKVLFQGNDAQQEAEQWQARATTVDSKAPKKESPTITPLVKKLHQANLIGSDEVGNGSYFGSLTVCAVYLPQDKQALVKELGVRDSKVLTDTQIRQIAADLKVTLTYKLVECPPIRYNKMTSTMNANQIKVALHNEALQALINEKMNDNEKAEFDGVLIDQFTSEKNFYHYLKNEPHPYSGKIHFMEKAESHNLAVASASIIARAAFVDSLVRLGKPYGRKLPSGAGKNVDLFAAELIRDHGEGALFKTAKLHFANTKKAKLLANKYKY
ncbi:ribonuclease HIII [Fundicoccus culcitae]|uniref:Ribonuclease HIII n=1 Tax=Fundicoccus culcitae TaxID=2969821 RepID=A0ABY5P7A1_9LACT|nr:ribonuclease HIII [Fundicoccus culcitae]UUX34617.1 ribonuclease HIII [Fundicoccus culcitae]